MNIEREKLLFVGFLEHYKMQILKSNGQMGLDIIMDDLENQVKVFREEFQK